MSDPWQHTCEFCGELAPGSTELGGRKVWMCYECYRKGVGSPESKRPTVAAITEIAVTEKVTAKIRGISALVLPSSDMPQLMQDKLDHTWVWFVFRQGMLIAAGSEVCSSIAWECAETVIAAARLGDDNA